MRVLTDDPNGAAGFLSGCIRDSWRDNLVAGERELVDALGLGRAITTDAHGAGAFVTTLMIVSEASGSQFTALDQLVRSGYALSGPVVSLALSGRHFRGQRDRTWIGAPGNLHVSIALPVHMVASQAGAAFAMLPAVAAVDAVSAATGGAVRPAIKWVNDIIIAEQKVGGVLTSAHITGHNVDSVLWGIGINLAVLPYVQPTPFVPESTCLRAVPGGEHVTLPAMFWSLMAAIETRFAELTRQGAASLFHAYRADSLILGRSVTVWDEADCHDADPARWGRPLAQGLVTGIRDDLGLSLDGECEIVQKGRLALSRVEGTVAVHA
ncbi:MAG: hypothetical protein ABIS06_15365 [Vicinamibacterales bacterium]